MCCTYVIIYLGVSPGVPPDNRVSWPLWRAYMLTCRDSASRKFKLMETALIRQSVNPLCLLQTLNLIQLNWTPTLLQISMQLQGTDCQKPFVSKIVQTAYDFLSFLVRTTARGAEWSGCSDKKSYYLLIAWRTLLTAGLV